TPQEFAQMSADERSRYESIRAMTNIAHFLNMAEVERLPATVQARKYFYQADRARRAGDRSRAVEVYENPAALGSPATWWKTPTGWKKLLLAHPNFKDDGEVQEETYDIQKKYLGLLQDRWAPHVKRLLVVQDFLAQVSTCPGAGGVWAPSAQLVRT